MRNTILYTTNIIIYNYNAEYSTYNYIVSNVRKSQLTLKLKFLKPMTHISHK